MPIRDRGWRFPEWIFSDCQAMVLGTKISQLADRAEVGRISGLTLAAAAKLPCAAHTTARARARSDGDVVRRRELGMALGGVQPQDPPRLRIRRPAALQALRAAPRWVPTRDPSRAPRHDPGPTAPPATLPQPDTPSPRVNPVPYLVSLPVPYLTDVKGFTNAQVTSDIFPVSVYASLAFYLVAGPVSAALGLKSFLVLGALCKLCTRAILIWGSSIHAMRLMQVLFAAGAASDLILFAYLYADPNDPPPREPTSPIEPPRAPSAPPPSARTPSPRNSDNSRSTPARVTNRFFTSLSSPSDSASSPARRYPPRRRRRERRATTEPPPPPPPAIAFRRRLRSRARSRAHGRERARVTRLPR